MLKNVFITLSAASIALFLVTACAEEGTEEGTDTHQTSVAKTSAQSDISVMQQAVDFSSPEAIEKTMQNIRDKEGDQAYNTLKNALQYIKVYDLSVGNSDEKLYKKLDGRTPEQIISKIKR